MIAKHGSAPAFGDAIAAMLTCETCGRTPADTLFSLRMRKRCRCLDPQVVRFQRCFGYFARGARAGQHAVTTGGGNSSWRTATSTSGRRSAGGCAVITLRCKYQTRTQPRVLRLSALSLSRVPRKCVTRAASAFAINAKPLEHNGSTSYFLSVVFFNNSPCAIFYVPIFLIRWSVDFL